jgi:hypothetical protein
VLARRVERIVALGPGASEHADRGAQLGEHTEAFDELGLDAQHPPGVGVHPIGGAVVVEQALVGGRAEHLGAAAQYWTVVAVVLVVTHQARLSAPGQTGVSSHERIRSSQCRRCANGTRSAWVWARTGPQARS